jgi:hypothetical protein
MQVSSRRAGISSGRFALLLGFGVATLLGTAYKAAAQTQVTSGFTFYQEDTDEAGSGYTESSPNYADEGMISVDPSVGGGGDGFINVVDGNGNWVVQNMPITPNESSATTSDAVAFTSSDGTQDTTFNGTVYFSTNAQSAAPSGGVADPYSVTADVIDPQGGGADPNLSTDEADIAPTITPAGAPALIPDPANWNGAAQGSNKYLIKNLSNYNVQAALNQCGTAAVANGLNYLAAGSTAFANALGVNNNSNPGQGVFNSLNQTNNTFSTIVPTGTYPYAGNASTYYVSTAGANSANSVQTLTNSNNANTSSLVAQLDIAAARQAGTLALNGAGPTYNETANRTAGAGVFPLQGIVNFLNPYASANLQINVGYESQGAFENAALSAPANPNLILTQQNGGNINFNSTPGWMYSQLSSGAAVTLSYTTYSYQNVTTWYNSGPNKGQTISSNYVNNSTQTICSHEVFVTGAAVTGTGANAQYQFLLSSDLKQGNDLLLGANPNIWATTVGFNGSGNKMFLNGDPSFQNQQVGAITLNGNQSTATITSVYTYVQNVETVSVPEPASASLLLIGAVGLLRRRMRRVA